MGPVKAQALCLRLDEIERLDRLGTAMPWRGAIRRCARSGATARSMPRRCGAPRSRRTRRRRPTDVRPRRNRRRRHANDDRRTPAREPPQCAQEHRAEDAGRQGGGGAQCAPARLEPAGAVRARVRARGRGAGAPHHAIGRRQRSRSTPSRARLPGRRGAARSCGCAVRTARLPLAAAIATDPAALKQILRLDRYERRALSRRKFGPCAPSTTSRRPAGGRRPPAFWQNEAKRENAMNSTQGKIG